MNHSHAKKDFGMGSRVFLFSDILTSTKLVHPREEEHPRRQRESAGSRRSGAGGKAAGKTAAVKKTAGGKTAAKKTAEKVSAKKGTSRRG